MCQAVRWLVTRLVRSNYCTSNVAKTLVTMTRGRLHPLIEMTCARSLEGSLRWFRPLRASLRCVENACCTWDVYSPCTRERGRCRQWYGASGNIHSTHSFIHIATGKACITLHLAAYVFCSPAHAIILKRLSHYGNTLLCNKRKLYAT
jgi:hypothetical protein